jgi:predicted NAD/FAD-dependent oxidoreductase
VGDVSGRDASGDMSSRVACKDSPGDASSTIEFDAVVLTPPAPQLLAMLGAGDGAGWLDAGMEGHLRSALRSLQYSSRYALSLFFDTSAAQVFAIEVDWVVSYVENDPTLVFFSLDSAKRGAAGPPTLVAHSSVPFGLKRAASKSPDHLVQGEMMEAVRRRLPWLPNPSAAKLYTWSVSQVRKPIDNLPAGRACLHVPPPAGVPEGAPPLLLAGDAFSVHGSRFDGCVKGGDEGKRVPFKASSPRHGG